MAITTDNKGCRVPLSTESNPRLSGKDGVNGP